MLILRLPELVGSPLSLNAVREDLQVSHKTIFRLSPLGAPLIRAVKKAQKHYHRDWSVNGRDLELRYSRDVDGREVDFVVTERHTPILLVERKWSDMNLDPGLCATSRLDSPPPMPGRFPLPARRAFPLTIPG